MNPKKMIENLIDEIQKDGKLGEQFEKEPVKVIEKVIGKDLPDDIVEKIIDGVKAKFEDGFALVRASNTGPNITMRFEATTEERLKELQEEFTNELNKHL